MEKILEHKSLQWWKTLPLNSKINYYEEFKDSIFYTLAVNYTELTDREIEIIYNAEHPTNSVLDTVEDTSDDGSNPVKKYVGVKFKYHSDEDIVYNIKEVNKDYVLLCWHDKVGNYEELDTISLSQIIDRINKGEYIAVKDESSEILPKESSDISPIDAVTKRNEAAKNYSKEIGNIDGTAIFDFLKGAEWQRDNAKSYSEEEVKTLLEKAFDDGRFCSTDMYENKYAWMAINFKLQTK